MHLHSADQGLLDTLLLLGMQREGGPAVQG